MPSPTVSVVIPTYNRPEHLRTCLEHLAGQVPPADAIVVVDASTGSESRAVVEAAEGVHYLRNDLGAGHTAGSRQIGVAATTTDVIAFVDDDAYASPGWLAALLVPYGDPAVSAVGGRAANGEPGEELEGADQVGRFLPDGTLTGFFAADPGHDVDVDHLLGANMSVRRAALDEVGGIRDIYPGTCLREETDAVLRMRMRGDRVVYTPAAEVRHVAGPYAKGRRFDLRYSYYAQRNHLVLLGATVGIRDTHFRRYLLVSLRAAGGEIAYAARAFGRLRTREGSVVRGVANGLLRSVSTFAGMLVGLGRAMTLPAAARGTTR
ncbi:glycosyltransferase family 2 protein [Cellulosimicrobium arenosum]|uniref:Glycosyltransferase family 2 protein n=1 Tax=Cellulosimicrobium arenosum TaxID=2708133 RepID=A0A927IZU6_9MICO|nr:glycosyltransferase family 2 protein [Cellulosimicrobium arenosum]MBD8078940.1 glycosyltransferase family 2 protein [Cellulosimicrobium arenosum]